MNHVDVALARREQEGLREFIHLQRCLGIKRPHCLQLSSMWQWMAWLTADGYVLVPTGTPGLYDRVDIRLPAKVSNDVGSRDAAAPADCV